MESRFPHAGAWSLEPAARIEVCLPISCLAGKDTLTLARGDLSTTQFRPSGETYPTTLASMPRDRVQPDCKLDSIPI